MSLTLVIYVLIPEEVGQEQRPYIPTPLQARSHIDAASTKINSIDEIGLSWKYWFVLTSFEGHNWTKHVVETLIFFLPIHPHTQDYDLNLAIPTVLVISSFNSGLSTVLWPLSDYFLLEYETKPP